MTKASDAGGRTLSEMGMERECLYAQLYLFTAVHGHPSLFVFFPDY